MSEDAAALLYDALYAFESRRRKGATYPVHKRLRFQGHEARDIYDWIADRVDLPDQGSVLDAGCGVGFGSIRLAQRSTCRVTGISLSEREIARARQVAAELKLTDRAQFAQASFDTLPREAYDVVVAVESLKHSPDLRRSLESLLGSLKHGGQLVIVEDLYARDGPTAAAQQLIRDWGLAKLYTQSDYVGMLKPLRCEVIDLTVNIPKASKAKIAARLVLLRLAMAFMNGKNATAMRAFRGGLHLERLYADGAMSYGAICCRAGQTASH